MDKSRSNSVSRIKKQSIIECSNFLNFSQNYSQDMEERPSNISFRHIAMVTPSDSYLTLPSPGGYLPALPDYDNSFLSSQTLYNQVLSVERMRFDFDIQAHIQAALPNDIVYVPGRVFQLKNLIIDRPLTLKGSKYTTIIVSESIVVDISDRDRLIDNLANNDVNIIGCKIHKVINDNGMPGELFSLNSPTPLCILDCIIANNSGFNSVLNCNSPDESSIFSLKSCDISSFMHLSQGNPLKSLSINLSTLSNFSEPLICRLPSKLSAIKSLFNGMPAFIQSTVSRMAIIDIDHCQFENFVEDAIDIDSCLTTCNVDCRITDCEFRDLNQAAIAQKFVNCVSMVIGGCNFEKVAMNCIRLDGSKNVRVINCSFKEIHGAAILALGSSCRVNKCSISRSLAGITIVGESQSKRTRKPNLHEHLNFPLLSLEGLYDIGCAIEISACEIDSLMGSGIDISDTANIECSISDCTITDCLNGLLIRDFDAVN